ncbi:homoserine dehydrogenase [Ligilactobacillus salitolerans]|uniref:Homoserine dehydrogenase n=1 Tax=Ligilactobacillus salitolerans TaxID=1808352 RepID=A0A401ISH6_9LACO|nr:homoserine dehydrogenase [Ligilactobacillus salitolerans]GBG94471.1 homoserine dehydrogenase [Ligilactobacillus salitolerans]
MKTIKLGIVGLGTVGTGVVRILQRNQQKVLETSGCRLEIKTIVVANLDKERKVDLTGIHLTDQIDELINDQEIQIAIEVMGTIEPARTYITALLNSGKNVITANKDLLATKGTELIECAQQNGVNLLYEASVAGGIPILRTVANSFTADQIVSVAGIVNGTSNYILTQMSENGLTYQQALEDAQALGLAETNPTNDVSGKDAAYKMAILTQFAFGVTVPLEKIAVAGITQITKDDITRAQKWGYSVKLIGQAQPNGDKLSISVEPMFVRKGYPLAAIKNENNAVLVTGSSVGEVMFYGAGAGELPTANSILSDVIATVKDLRLHTTGAKFNTFSRAAELTDPAERTSKYFLALSATDDGLTEPSITQLLSQNGLNLAAQLAPSAQPQTELGYKTQPISASRLAQLKAAFAKSSKLTLTAAYPVLE